MSATNSPYTLFVGAHVNLGGRDYQEDRLCCIKNLNAESEALQTSTVPRSFFGCFDGHGGFYVSDFLGQNFYKQVATHPKLKLQAMAALQESWQSMDDKCYSNLGRIMIEKNLGELPRDGSTGTVCLVNGEDIYVTNCGDSTAYAFFEDGTHTILTEDHGTLNAEEVKRIQSAGGNLKPQLFKVNRSFPLCCTSTFVEVGKPRVFPGGLLVTRAFGDFNAKIKSLGGSPGIVVHDHGRVQYLQLSSRTLKYLVIGSDGVWDALTPEEVRKIIEDRKSGVSSGPSNVGLSTIIPVNSESTIPKEHVTFGQGDLSEPHCSIAQSICMSAIQGEYWKQVNAPADNTSCIVLEFQYNS